MRILVVKVPHDNSDRFTWILAYSLPFTPVGACNYGSEDDVVYLHLTYPKTHREAQAQGIFANHVRKIAADMHKNVSESYHKPDDIVSCGHRDMSLSWLTDHTKGGAAA